MPLYQFQVLKKARKKYRIESSLFSINGDLVIANFRQARLLARNINTSRAEEGITDKLVTPGQVNAAGLLHEIFHFLIKEYEKQNSGVMDRAVYYLKEKTGGENFEKILIKFVTDFPPPEVDSGKLSPAGYLSGSTGEKNNREIVLEELLLLNIGNNNPATESLNEIFSDKSLKNETHYEKLIDLADVFFGNEKPFGEDNLPLTQFLRQPILTHPRNLQDQLGFVRKKWGLYIYEKFGDRILSGRDLFAEDSRSFGIGFIKSTPPVPEYKHGDSSPESHGFAGTATGIPEDELNYYYTESEKFTPDTDWMPGVVMMAKNIYVWLDQLSKKYGRQISRLDQVPDEELDRLAGWNFTSLWLIGIWERSSASKRIKQLTGNPEAAPSAYSLFDYVIAGELGGDQAFENFKYRAWQRGIRLASDMVPNHTGIFSKWIIEKPEYFIQSDFPPFPNYSFTGENLSDNPDIEVRIEDKYYSREDAAVVFQRKDNRTGSIKYIYHGNDGTGMPWNDTAQLNLLVPEVRESLIQTIMHVARKFPIIRFDAAMTLTKKHYARLWFPRPGTGGAIPARSDFALKKTEFDAAMPEEFWREVVDRINREMPSTLLLAEAFWLMEGYFVRTLGMHRVYNSAFMHMMMKEENDKYRELIKNTLEFDPEILKRYVNFMSNPDEETAISQFGNGDKYFGVLILMITLPGLPMFGHGQVEGLKEKYGMEYKRAYYDEGPDGELIRRHEAEIFPLMERRSLFSQSENFELYDFFDDRGYVNENVIAYSNRSGSERAIILYNNSYERAAGTIAHACKKNRRNGHAVSPGLTGTLNITTGDKYFYAYTNSRTRFRYLLKGDDILHNGMYFRLEGYEYYALVDFTEIVDQDGSYERLYHHLAGKGVYSLEDALIELNLEPVRTAFAELLREEIFEDIEDYLESGDIDKTLPDSFIERLADTVSRVNGINRVKIESGTVLENAEKDFSALRSAKYFLGKTADRKSTPEWLKIAVADMPLNDYEILIPILILDLIYNNETNGRELFDMLDTYNILNRFYTGKGISGEEIYRNIFLVKSITSREKLHLWKNSNRAGSKNENMAIYLSDLMFGKSMKACLNIHDYEGITYFNRENFEELLRWLFILSVKEMFNSGKLIAKERLAQIKSLRQFFDTIKSGASQSGYDIKKFKQLLLNGNGLRKSKPVKLRILS